MDLSWRGVAGDRGDAVDGQRPVGRPQAIDGGAVPITLSNWIDSHVLLKPSHE